jgi:acyl dehydratase
MKPIAVGDILPALEMPPINRTTLALYAGASGDHNPIHIDLDFARKSGMPDVFAHGMLSMAYVGRLLTQWAPQDRLRGFQARFSGITHLGHAVRCTGKITEIVEEEGERRAKVAVQAANQYGDVKIVGEAIIAI